MIKPNRMLNSAKDFRTKSNKEVILYFSDSEKCYGFYLNRNNEYIKSSWNLNGQWLDSFESSMDIIVK